MLIFERTREELSYGKGLFVRLKKESVGPGQVFVMVTYRHSLPR